MYKQNSLLFLLACFCLLSFQANAEVSALPTVITTEMVSGLYSERSEIGDRVQVKVIEPINLRFERIFIPVGAIIEGRVTEVQEAGHGLKRGKVKVAFNRISYPNGFFLDTEGALMNSNVDPGDEEAANIKGKSSWTQNIWRAGKVGVGALIGGPIGATFAAGTLVFDKGGKVRIKPGDQAYVKIARVSTARNYDVQGKLADQQRVPDTYTPNVP